MRRIYLDHNATVPVQPDVVVAVAQALSLANPSSVHTEGRAARAAVEQARARVAALVRASSRHVVFTSGGTEANVTVLVPGLRERDESAGPSSCKAMLLLMSETEHPCVREGHRFGPDNVEHIPVGRDGLVDLGWLEARLTRFEAEFPGQRAMISVHLANNETGVIQPVRAISELARRFDALVHCDGVQAAGRIDIDITRLDVDILTLSAHKLGGPKGVGAIVFRNGRLYLAEKLLRGGGQEVGWRAGTENVAGIIGFGVAAEIAAGALATERSRLSQLRDELERRVVACAPETIIFGKSVPRLPNTSAFATPGVSAETALIQLDLAGISISSGSACSSGKVKQSHVLRAMGVASELSKGALRVSLGWTTTAEDIDWFIDAYTQMIVALLERHKQAAA
jgi:cysteine desulfurase